jgi:hypothetical protein
MKVDRPSRPASELSPEERAEVNKIALVLLDRLNQLLGVNLRQKSAARSQLQPAIEGVLDTGLPRTYPRKSPARKAPPFSSTAVRRARNGSRACMRRCRGRK